MKKSLLDFSLHLHTQEINQTFHIKKKKNGRIRASEKKKKF